jgi:hypothetical protein
MDRLHLNSPKTDQKKKMTIANTSLTKEKTCVPQRSDYKNHPVLSTTIHPDIKKTLVSMSERTGLSISQVTDEVLYAGLVEMQEMDELEDRGGGA